MKLPNPLKRDPITRETKETQELPDLRGPLTAREALNALLPAVRQTDEEFKLTFIGSQEGITPEGRAYGWDFFFDFPRRKGLGVYTARLCPSEEDDEGPWCIDLSVRPVFDPRTKGYKIPPLPPQPALPLEFRDSAEAAQTLASQGADFLSGDGHMTLSTKVLSNGTAVWRTTIWDKPYETPFA